MQGNTGHLDPRAQRVIFPDPDHFSVELVDGRTITVPVAWSPRLARATEEQRTRVVIESDGTSLRWPDPVDEDIQVVTLLSADGPLYFWPDVDMRIENPKDPFSNADEDKRA